MDKQGIEILVENKIKDAKLELSERRFQLSEQRLKFALSLVLGIGALLLTAFGLIVPLLISMQSTKKVDQAIQNMERKFEQLAGLQLRKPEIQVYLDGERLEGSLLQFINGEPEEHDLQIKNIGDARAEIVALYIYVGKNVSSAEMPDHLFTGPMGVLSGDYIRVVSDELEYPRTFKTYFEPIVVLDPKDYSHISLRRYPSFEELPDQTVPLLLKIFYGQPEPKRIMFSVIWGK